MTDQEALEIAARFASVNPEVQARLRSLALRLAAAREVTEKVTRYELPVRYLQYGDILKAHYVVSEHKARVVLDG